MLRSLAGGDPSHRTIRREAELWITHMYEHSVYTHTHNQTICCNMLFKQKKLLNYFE